MYNAKIIRVREIVKHPGADRLQLIKYNGMQFVVDLSFSEGELVCLFPTDGQLSDDFCKFNNLYRDATKNSDKQKAGFFEDTRRVRAQPFRKEKSEGFVCKLDAFDYLGSVRDQLVEGLEFDSLNGKTVCEKYVTEATRKAMSRRGIKSVKVVDYSALKEHYETDQLDYKVDRIKGPCFVVITEKLHGTSGRTGYVPVERVRDNLFMRCVNYLGRKLFKRTIIDKDTVREYERISGTRRTVINNRPDCTTPGSEEYYRWLVHNDIAPLLKKGETVYYEIVGFTNNQVPIMNTQSTKKLSKELQDRFLVDPMVYSYGCDKALTRLWDVYVYRITMQGDGGDAVDLSWFQMNKRCNELSLKVVPVMHMGFYKTDKTAQRAIKSHVALMLDDSASTLDKRHLMEGVVVRIENLDGIDAYKSKNYSFKLLEGIVKEDPNAVDTEESN